MQQVMTPIHENNLVNGIPRKRSSSFSTCMLNMEERRCSVWLTYTYVCLKEPADNIIIYQAHQYQTKKRRFKIIGLDMVHTTSNLQTNSVEYCTIIFYTAHPLHCNNYLIFSTRSTLSDFAWSHEQGSLLKEWLEDERFVAIIITNKDELLEVEEIATQFVKRKPEVGSNCF
eukprot:m.131715 g.131715  ORF g.131715 m.131715 type:complete len:172 (-) comp9477_c1_seq38:1023-1538(-)